MHKKVSPLSYILFVVISSFFHLAIFAEQCENQLIGNIEVVMMNISEGSDSDANAIKTRIKSREGDLFSQIAFDNDLKILANDFDRVDPIIECVDNKLNIKLKIWPKPIIRAITWKGNDKIDTESLLSELAIPPRSVFDRRGFNQAFHKLKAYYVQKGFFEAQLSYEIVPDDVSNQVDIHITVCEGRSGRIKEIVFCGFNDADIEKISEMMVTKTYNFFLSWITEEGTYREEAVQHDELIILNYLQNLGYADAQVKIEVCEAKESDRILIKIIAEKGLLYRLGELTFSNNTLFCNDEILKRFTVHSGDIYSPEAIRETVTSITNLYGRYGYIDAIVDYEPILVHDQCIYNIHFTLEEGQQFRVGLIKVFGNCHTQNKVILHETLLIPGEVFNIEKLKYTEERLTNIGFFKNVNVYAVKSEGPCGLGDNYRDVHIEVEETSTGHFGLFFGYSTSESLFGGFNITENNFNIQGVGCLFSKGPKALRGGGEYAHFTTTIGTKSRSYVFSWTKPYFMDTPWLIGFDIERTSNRYVSNDYDIETTGFTLRGAYPINQFVRFGTHYRMRYTHFHVTGKETRQLRETEKESTGLLSAVGMSWTYDSTNHPTCPTNGFKSRAESEFAGLGGKQTFFNFGYLNSYYFQLPGIDKEGVWRVRGDMRFLVPVGRTTEEKIPIDERLFLGGDYMIRGYKPYRLGPKYHRTDDPKGGASLQLISIEYSRPFFKRFDLFAFFDAGHLSDRLWNFGRMDMSAGYGIKLCVLPGTAPLVIGMGYPLNPRSRSDVKRFFISIGGRF